MTIEAIERAPSELFCWRCQSLGITTPTILKNDGYVRGLGDNGNKVNACLDCWDRLTEECEAMD